MQKIIQHHPNCKEPKCEICLHDHEKLGKLLDELCDTNNTVDHLGKYHKWLGDNGINPETKWGWATPETFDSLNIKKYIHWFLEIKQNYKEAKESSDEQNEWQNPLNIFIVEEIGDI